MKRIIDSNARLMAMGYNKLIEEWKAHRNELRKKLQFVIQSLTDKEARYKLQAYNSLMERKRMLDGIGMTSAQMKKVQLVRRLASRGFNLQVLGINALVDFLRCEKETERLDQEEFERQLREKERICKRVMYSNIRLMGLASRMLRVHCEEEQEKERQRVFRKKGVCNRMADSNKRLMGMGYNKLLEEWKVSRNNLRNKLKFVIQSLSDKDSRFILQAYRGLKSQRDMLNGIGATSAE